MDENEFLRGIEGEQQNGQDLVSGAEHLIRLKKQVGITRPAEDDLELEKEAGEFAESLATPSISSHCKDCGKVKTACMCGSGREKTANPLQSVLLNARIKTAAAHSIPAFRLDLHQHLNVKLAEVRAKTANAIIDRLRDVNPGLVAATGIGALAGGIGTYLSSRPQEDTGKSKTEEALEGKVESQKGQPERGLLSKMHNRNTELEHGYAQAFREHPNKAAILGTITGAMGGYGIGRLAGGVAKLRGGK